MHVTRNGVFATAASLLLFGTMGIAQSSGTSSVAPSDRHFMDKAAQGGMAEVELGQLAQQNGESQQVKDFGKRMVDDHSKANEELKTLAGQKGVTLPTTLNKQDEATKTRLSSLHGAAFDRAYMSDMVKDHKKDVAEFKVETTSARDPQLKEWATKTLPTLQEHLKLAEQIAPQPKGQAATMKNNPTSNGVNNTSSDH
jgi:putative membrane protein